MHSVPANPTTRVDAWAVSNSHCQAHYQILAEAEPDVLCRILNYFALQFLVPQQVNVTRDDDLLHIDVVMDGLTCHTARSAKEAIDVLLELQGTAEQINVVVSDIEMSEMDGYALTRTLRETPDFQELYVLLHTSLDSAMNSEKARLAGADAVLTKFSSPELTKCLVVAAQTVAQKGL